MELKIDKVVGYLKLNRFGCYIVRSVHSILMKEKGMQKLEGSTTAKVDTRARSCGRSR